jgi:hypothetical protein
VSRQNPTPGEVYLWPADTQLVRIEVVRIRRGGKTADIRCTDIKSGDAWDKPQPIPFPETFTEADP